MQVTKKAKLEQFDTLQRERDLLQRFFWDTCEGMPATARASYRTKDGDKFKATLYAPNRADGGYIVVEANPGTPSIQYYDNWSRMVAGLPFAGEFTLAMKSLAEQIRRNIPAHHSLQHVDVATLADWPDTFGSSGLAKDGD